jgi:hypothetical protein
MKRIIMAIAVLILLCSIKLSAGGYSYDFEFEIVGARGWELIVETKENFESPYILRRPPSSTGQGSQIVTWSVLAPPPIISVRVSATGFPTGASFFEERDPTLHGTNYFLIDLSPPMNPHGAMPEGGDE